MPRRLLCDVMNLRTFLDLDHLVGSDSLFVVGSLLSVVPLWAFMPIAPQLQNGHPCWAIWPIPL
jgi:hypothetical protein